MTKPDPLRVIEAGYDWIEDEAAWLRGICDAAQPFALSTGVAAFTLGLAKKPSVTTFHGRGTPAAFESHVRAFTTALGAVARDVYAPTEFVGNARWRVRRLAQKRGRSAEELTRGHSIAAWALVAGDPRQVALTLAFPASDDDLPPERPFPRARVLGFAAAHLAAALRLRRLAAPNPDGDATESVLSPAGKVLHATGDARATAARDSLVEAVSRRERARGRMRKVDSDEAARLWSALVAGKWSIVDFVDRDGKRLLLARKNPVGAPDVLALTSDERDVVWLATHGHSRKYIAYELGISVSQVARRLASAMRKLRVTSRRELLQRFGGT